MALTTALVNIVIFMPAVTFSMGGADFRLMSYGISGGDGGAMMVLDGVESAGGVIVSTLSVCTVTVLALAALVPFVSIFLFRRRQLQARLLGAEFALILGGAGLMVWYVWSSWGGVVSSMADNSVLSIFPALLIVALVTNFAALKGVLRDELLVRSADRIR
jgi:glucan phosphoethanolaminetransferase (alkaline phosphatase superfamily)